MGGGMELLTPGLTVGPQRTSGTGRVSAKSAGGKTRLDVFYQEGAAKIRIPESFDGAMEAVLINTSRGPIVDEAAMIEALKTNKIKGAGLDVFDVEPLPADHELRKLDNTVLTGHLGYVMRENYEQMYPDAVECIKGWMDGAPVRVLNAAD